jgi:hypothetical protein
MTVVSQISSHLLLNERLSADALAGSILHAGAMKTLTYIRDRGSIGLTKNGAFNRKFVTWAVDEFQWPRYTADDLYAINKILNEDDVLPLRYLHHLLLDARLIRHARDHARLTGAGRTHLSQPGLLQVALFETFFTRFDFAAHERWPIEIREADLFHFLGVVCNRLTNWVPYPEFAGWCLPIFALQPQRGTPEEDAMFYLETRLIRPLKWLGLVEAKENRRYAPINSIQLRKTSLLDAFMRFEDVCDDLGNATRH